MLELQHHAKHDPAICGAPGLFRSLKRGSRATPLAIVYKYGSETLQYSSDVLLGCDDLRILQGVMALASGSNVAIHADSSRETSRRLRSALRLSGAIAQDAALLVETSLAKLALVAGYADSGGAMGMQVRASLARLSGCSVECISEDATSGWQLLSWDENGPGRNRLRVALNPRSSECAFSGERPKNTKRARYTWINMDEARSLQDDVSRLCHQRLSTWIDAIPHGEKKQQRVRLATLWSYAWSDEVHTPDAAAARQRRATLRTTINKLKSIGWKVEEVDVGAGLYYIERPSPTPRRLAA